MDKLKSYDEKISYLKCSEKYESEMYSYIDEDGEECNQPNMDDRGIAFPIRYNADKIKFPKTYQDYQDNINIQMSIKALGLDIEKFWFFILYAYDLSGEKTRNIMPWKESAKSQFRKFIDTIDSAFEVNDGKFVYKNNEPIKINDAIIEIKINGKKQKAIIDNKYALIALSNLMETYLEGVEEGSRFDTRYGDLNLDKWDNETLSTRNYLVITYFKELFNYLKSNLKRGKADIYNKNILIAEVLLFMRLIEEEQANEDYIKNTLKYYKGKTVTLSSFSAYY